MWDTMGRLRKILSAVPVTPHSELQSIHKPASDTHFTDFIQSKRTLVIALSYLQPSINLTDLRDERTRRSKILVSCKYLIPLGTIFTVGIQFEFHLTHSLARVHSRWSLLYLTIQLESFHIDRQQDHLHSRLVWRSLFQLDAVLTSIGRGFHPPYLRDVHPKP